MSRPPHNMPPTSPPEPACFVCEWVIEPGEPFAPLMVAREPGQAADLMPVHFACQLGLIAERVATIVVDSIDAGEVVQRTVAGRDDDGADLRLTLRRLATKMIQRVADRL